MAAAQSFQHYQRLRPSPDPAQVGAMLGAQRGPMMSEEPEPEPEVFAPPMPQEVVEDDGSMEHSPLSTATALQEAIQRAMRGPSRPQERRQRGAYSAQQLAALLPATERAFLEP